MAHRLLLAVLATLAAALAPAGAAPALPRTTPMREGGPVLAPLAFVRFCLAYREECATETSSGTIALDEARYHELDTVNRDVNARVRPRRDDGKAWSLDAAEGDCNDYAVTKRAQLRRRGYPEAALLLTHVVTRSGDPHLVLTVRTDRGDLLLDNLRPGIVPWTASGYRFVRRQSAGAPSRWVALGRRAGADGAAVRR